MAEDEIGIGKSFHLELFARSVRHLLLSQKNFGILQERDPDGLIKGQAVLSAGSRFYKNGCQKNRK
jgi:hypothetical protein